MADLAPDWGIDVAGLVGWLDRAGHSMVPPVRVERVGAGQSNLVLVAQDSSGRRCVLRRPPLGELLETAHDVTREHRILSALQGSAVRVPKVIGLVVDTDICTAPCLVMEYVEGIILDDEPTAAQLAVDARRRFGVGLVDSLVALHAIDPKTIGLADLAVDAPYAPRQLRRWTRQWEASKPPGRHLVDSLTSRLAAAVPAETERRIVHGDLHPRNLMVHADGTPSAVLDWELCTLGDPLADLGTLLAYWPEPEEPDSLVAGVTRLDGFASRRELVSLYAERSGRATASIAFWHVLGLWKLAIIGQGVLRRVQADPRNEAPGAPSRQEHIDSIAVQAARFADDYGL